MATSRCRPQLTRFAAADRLGIRRARSLPLSPGEGTPAALTSGYLIHGAGLVVTSTGYARPGQARRCHRTLQQFVPSPLRLGGHRAPSNQPAHGVTEDLGGEKGHPRLRSSDRRIVAVFQCGSIIRTALSFPNSSAPPSESSSCSGMPSAGIPRVRGARARAAAMPSKMWLEVCAPAGRVEAMPPESQSPRRSSAAAKPGPSMCAPDAQARNHAESTSCIPTKSAHRGTRRCRAESASVGAW